MNKTLNPIITQFFNNYSLDHQQTIVSPKAGHHLILLKTVIIPYEHDHHQTLEALQQQKNIHNEHILSLIDYHPHHNQHAQLQLQLFYQYSKMTLTSQINIRKSQANPFSQQQLWNIMLSIVEGAAYLQSNGIGHGCISPQDIYITHEGVVKLADPTFASANPFIFNQGSYYSTELLTYFQDGNLSNQFNIYKSDVFSLGMTMVEAALLQPPHDCYSIQHLSISRQNLDNKLMEIQSQYSSELLEMLVWMLESVENRPDFVDLKQEILRVHDYQTDDQQYNNMKFSAQSDMNCCAFESQSMTSIKEYKCAEEEIKTFKFTSRTNSKQSQQSRNLLNLIQQSKISTLKTTSDAEQYQNILSINYDRFPLTIKQKYFTNLNHNDGYTDPLFMHILRKEALAIMQSRKITQ